MVKRGFQDKMDSDIERIQSLFPNDNLRLSERDPITPRKGLVRSKSSAALKLQKALPGKSKALIDGNSNQQGEDNVLLTGLRKQSSEIHVRTFIMEGAVRFTIGVQSHERHLFLFNDLLLIAKPRSGGTYKLKEKVLICELWISSCIEEVSDLTIARENSIVIGWPTTNVVSTFSSRPSKEIWETKFEQLIDEAKQREGNKVTTSLQISINNQNIKLIKVNNRHTAKECIKTLVDHTDNNNGDPNSYQLWVKTGKEESPYPLIGHEYLFCIKMNFIRKLMHHTDLEFTNFDEISSDIKCTFMLRKKHQKVSLNNVKSMTPKEKKPRKASKKIWPFKRHKQDSVDSGHGSPPPPSKLFNQPLAKVCSNGNLPPPIMAILTELYSKGPYTVGIFRKSANARCCRELKLQLESEPNSDIHDVPVLVLASVLKEYLRGIPNGVLHKQKYEDWMKAFTHSQEADQQHHVLNLLQKLPLENFNLLKHVICLLWHLAHYSEENKMTPSNLALCIGPSILNTSPNPHIAAMEATESPRIVIFLIENFPYLFGPNADRCLGPPLERDTSRQDSGAEESDSLHSLQEIGGVYRRDDSSIDSIDREFIMEEDKKFPFESKMSLTNLSRDSGLTLSDTQLYAPEDEESGEQNDGVRARVPLSTLAKSAPHLEVAGLDGTNSKITGISIDGSCHDVVKKRNKCHELNANKRPVKYINYETSPNPHIPLNYSLSYSYGMQQSPETSEPHPVPNYPITSVKRRVCRGRTCNPQPILSAIDPTRQDCPPTVPSLRRSASEESLIHKYPLQEQISPENCSSSRKRRAPSPPQQQNLWHSASQLHTPLTSHHMPDRHAIWFANQNRNADWKRSQSISKINEPSYNNSSTLSLESTGESITPRISRSSSRLQDSFITIDHKTSLYASTPRISSICSSSSDTSLKSHLSRSSKASSHHSQGSSDGFSSKPPSPPSYQEALCRKTLLHRLNTSPIINKNVTDEMRQHQTFLSAKARQLYENSLKKYNEQSDTHVETHHAVLVKVDSNIEMKNNRKSLSCSPSKMHHPSLQRTTSESPRLRQLPPVHVSDAQLGSQRMPNKLVMSPVRALRDEISEDWRKEISWSVAELRTIFTPKHSSPEICCNNKTKVITNNKSSIHHHRRSDSVDSRNSGEESFV